MFKREVGEFTVPAGAAGEYWINAGVVMDTHDWHIDLNKAALVMSSYK